ncbi:MAG: C10 family peptidase [Bacteroidales bacterium]|nr:C10 family peptidase [Bacteroidales bacterium]
MKKFNNHTILVLGFLLSLTTSVQLWANPVDVATARRVAFNFMRLQGYDISSPKEMANVSNILGLGNIYVFNTPDRPGYVVVSANDCYTPILAFSSQGFFPEHPHCILQSWYRDCNNLIEAFIVQKTESVFASRWEMLLDSKQVKTQAAKSPHGKWCLTTEWGTGAGYNKYCPFDIEGDGFHADAGSFAVAAAQIINYWGQKPLYHNNWVDPYDPWDGTADLSDYAYYLVPVESRDSTLADNRPYAHDFYHGSKRYEDPNYGTQYANFARKDTIYDFNSFPDKKDQPNDYQNQRIYNADKMAEFIYHVGVSMEMQYDKVNSLPQDINISRALENSLGTHWGFETGRRAPRDQYLHSFNAANSSLHYRDAMQKELRLGRPFMFQFKDTTSGYVHYSVCDGYHKDNTGAYAHLNMCKGGDGNGFYYLIIDDSTYIINGEAYGSSHYIEFSPYPPEYTPAIVLTYIYSFTPNPFWFHTDKDYAEFNEDYGSDDIRVFLPAPYPESDNFSTNLDIIENINQAQSGVVFYDSPITYSHWFAGRQDDPVRGFNIHLTLRKSTNQDMGNGNSSCNSPTVFDDAVHQTTFSFSPIPWDSLSPNVTSAYWINRTLYEDTTFTIPIYYSKSTFNTPDTIICDNGEFDYAVSSEDLHSEGCRIQQHWGIAFAPELFSGYDTIIGFQYYATDTEPTCGIIYETNHGYLDTTAAWPYQCRGQAENCQATEEGWNTHLFSTPLLVSTWTSNGTKPFWIELSARSNGMGAWAANSTGSTNSSCRSFLCRPSENENGSLSVGYAGQWNSGEWTEVTGNIQWMIRPLVKGRGIPKPYKVKTDFMECPNISWYAPENYRKFQIVIGEKGYIPGNADSLASIYVPADECNHEQGTNYFEKHLCDLYYGREEGPILQDGKDYDAYIRIIGDYNMAGPWSDPGTLEAPCYNIQQLPFSEDFKNGCPRCWTDESEGYLTWLLNSGLWIEHLYNPDSIVVAKDGTGTGSEETFAMLVTPEIDFSSITPSQIAQLSFLQRQTCAVQADTDYMDVLYRVFEGYPIYEWSAWTTLKRDTVTNTNIEAVVIDLPSPTSTWATIQFAFNINVKKSVMAVFSDLLIQAVPRPATPAPDNAAPPMYPNPSAGVFTVDCPDVQEIEALDVMGRSVKKVVNTNVIDITNRPPGTYMLRVTTGAGVSVGKVSKK